jgi:hypothetical protein
MPCLRLQRPALDPLMTAHRITQNIDWYPVHCAACLQNGTSTPATWIVNQGQGTNSYHACDQHRDLLERHGVKALNRRFRKPV